MEATQKKRNSQTEGTVLALMAALLWSTNAPLIKSLSLDATLVAGMRALIAGGVLLPFLRPKKIKWGLPVVSMMVFFTLQSLFIVVALQKTSAAIAVGMQYTAPVWLYLIARLRHEAVSRSHLVSLGVLTVGVAVSMCSRSGEVTLLGNIIALSTGIWFALLTLAMQRVGGENPLGTVSLNNLFMAAVLLCLCAAQGKLGALKTMRASEWVIMLILGVFQFGGGYVCYNLCLRKISGTRAAMITPLEMVFGPLWVAVFLHQYPDVIGLIGFLIIALGVVIEVVYTHRREKSMLQQMQG